jgi:hypothetical protein
MERGPPISADVMKNDDTLPEDHRLHKVSQQDASWRRLRGRLRLPLTECDNSFPH